MTAVGDILELSYGKALKEADRDGGDVPVVGSAGVVGGHSAGITDAPTIVVGRKGSIGSVTWIDGPAWPIDTAYFVKPKRQDLDRRWAYWMLRSLRMGTMNKSAAVPGLNRDDVYRLDVILPPLPEQRRIAAILDQADTIRTKRRQVLAHLDSLTQAIFHEMFEKTLWPTAVLDDVCILAGEYGANVPSIDWREGLPRYVRITDVTSAGYLTNNFRAPGGDAREWARHALADGDLLFARSGATVGKSYRYRESDGDCVFAGYLIRYRPNRDIVDPEYLFALTKTVRYESWVAARQNVVAQPNINAKQYGRELPIPLPPIGLQRAFARKAALLHRQRNRVEQAIRIDDELFAALQARAFRGEL